MGTHLYTIGGIYCIIIFHLSFVHDGIQDSIYGVPSRPGTDQNLAWLVGASWLYQDHIPVLRLCIWLKKNKVLYGSHILRGYKHQTALYLLLLLVTTNIGQMIQLLIYSSIAYPFWACGFSRCLSVGNLSESIHIQKYNCLQGRQSGNNIPQVSTFSHTSFWDNTSVVTWVYWSQWFQTFIEIIFGSCCLKRD